MRVIIELTLPRLPDPWNVARILFMGVLALFCLLFLTACPSWAPKREIEYVPYEVKVPVPVPCAAEAPADPAYATEVLRKSDTLDDKVKALLTEREQRRGHQEKLKAAVAGCR